MIRRLITCIILSCACATAQAQDRYIKTIAGCDSVGFGGDGGPAIHAKLTNPQGITLDGRGNLLIADYGNQRVRKVELSTNIITTIAGCDSYGYAGDGSPATAAKLLGPEAVLVDALGNIFLADLNNTVRKIFAVTGIITTIAGTGSAGSTGDGQPATNAELNAPVDLGIDRLGNIYIAEFLGNRVRKIDAITGIISTIAGTGGAGFSGNGGLAVNAELNGPAGVALDSLGNILICDGYNYQIRKVDASTGIISAYAGTGTPGYSGDGGLAINAQFDGPTRGCIDAHGNFFVADYSNGAIRKIDGKTGIITTIAGDGTFGFYGDNGPATSAELGANAVILDSAGTVYISDENNDRIRMLYSPLAVNPSPVVPDIAIYPNPVSGILNIEHAQGCELNICNLLGLPVFHAKILTEQWAGEISDLPDGVYIAQFTDEYGVVISKKIVKE